MVGAGKLIELLFGISYLYAVMLVGVLMVAYVTFGGMLATTWVQIIKAVLLLSGASFMAFMVLKHFGFSTEAMFASAVAVHAKGQAIMARRPAVQPGGCHFPGPGHDVRYRRPAAHPDALLHRQ